MLRASTPRPDGPNALARIAEEAIPSIMDNHKRDWTNRKSLRNLRRGNVDMDE